MQKLLLLVAVLIPMLLNPVAHAAGYGCDDRGAVQTEHSAKKPSGDTQDDGKPANAAHHCLCSHASIQPVDPAAPLHSVRTASRGFLTEEAHLGSIVVGPPLQPPSIA